MSDERLDAQALRRALEAWTQAEADERDIPVDLGEIWAYVSGSLPVEEADGVAERIVRDPQAARLAASMASFFAQRDDAASGQRDGGEVVDGLSSQELEQDWQRLCRRVGMGGVAMDSPAASDTASRPDRATAATAPTRSWLPAALAAAAGVVLALGVGFLGQSRLETERRAPRLNVEPIVIWEDATRRGAAEPTRIPGDAAFHLLVLKLVPGDEGPDPLAFDDHALEIWPEEGQATALWRASGVRVEDDLTVTLEINREFLAPGSYELRLLGLEGIEEQILATFAIELP